MLSARSSRRITGDTGSWYAGSTRSPARSARWAAATPACSPGAGPESRPADGATLCRPGEPAR